MQCWGSLTTIQMIGLQILQHGMHTLLAGTMIGSSYYNLGRCAQCKCLKKGQNCIAALLMWTASGSRICTIWLVVSHSMPNHPPSWAPESRVPLLAVSSVAAKSVVHSQNCNGHIPHNSWGGCGPSVISLVFTWCLVSRICLVCSCRSADTCCRWEYPFPGWYLEVKHLPSMQ